MHHSRLQSVVVDCDDLEAGVRFWSQALGCSVVGGDDTYVRLKDPITGLRFLLQRVPEDKASKSRIHLDIESDNVEAESRRLEDLGARRLQFIEGWWVMLDPNDNEFCVVPIPQSGFGGEMKTWEDAD